MKLILPRCKFVIVKIKKILFRAAIRIKVSVNPLFANSVLGGSSINVFRLAPRSSNFGSGHANEYFSIKYAVCCFFRKIRMVIDKILPAFLLISRSKLPIIVVIIHVVGFQKPIIYTSITFPGNRPSDTCTTDKQNRNKQKYPDRFHMQIYSMNERDCQYA